jgi:hypothetical protein
LKRPPEAGQALVADGVSITARLSISERAIEAIAASQLGRVGEVSFGGQFAPSLQGVGYGESNTVTGRWSLGDPNGERVPQAEQADG